MTRLSRISDERVAGPQESISLAGVQQAFKAYRDALDKMERRFALSDRYYLRVYANRNFQEGLDVCLHIAGETDTNSGWPMKLVPAEIMKLAELRAMVEDWVTGRTESLPPSTWADTIVNDAGPFRR